MFYMTTEFGHLTHEVLRLDGTHCNTSVYCSFSGIRS